MRTGELDQLVALHYPTEVINDGELITTYTPIDETIFAKVVAQSGTEAFEAARTNARETIRLKLRYRDDVLTTWRLVWENQIYTIKAVDRSKRRAGELWLTAEVNGAF